MQPQTHSQFDTSFLLLIGICFQVMIEVPQDGSASYELWLNAACLLASFWAVGPFA
jgi:hypothetical protein